MSSSEIDSNEMLPVVLVSLDISEANVTINGTKARIFEKSNSSIVFLQSIDWFFSILAPSRDTSLNGIFVGIGVVVVILIVLLIIVKLLYRAIKICKTKDDEEKNQDPTRKSPLLPSSSSTPVVIRKNSAIRNPSASIHRSSLTLETQVELRQKRFSQISYDTPPTIKRN